MEMLNHITFDKEKIDTQSIDLDALLAQSKVDIERCTALIMGRYKFFGEFIYKFRILYTYRVPTMATDGKNFFINPLFCSTLNDKSIVFVLCHEILHNVLVHFLRRENMDAEHKRWNHATDHEINLMLIEEGFLTKQQVDELGGLADEQYKEMTAEEIYKLLPESTGNETMEWPVEIGSVIKSKTGKYGVVEKINSDGTFDIKEITYQEAKDLLTN